VTTPAAESNPDHEVAVAERVRPRDLLLFAITAVAIAATPWMLTSAGSDPIAYRDSRGLDTEAPAWMGVLVYLVPFLAWSGMKAFHLLQRPAAAIIDPDRIRLFPEIGGLYLRAETPRVDLPWEEVERIVVWRIRRRWLWCIPGWESRVGVERTTDWYEVAQQEPTKKQQASRDFRRDGSPVRLGAMLNARSVRLAPRGATTIASATARFAPSVNVVDERTPGEPQVIQPKSTPKRHNY
jgi:hypothetical protein